MARKKSKEELNLDNVELDENGEPVESKGSKLTSFLVGRCNYMACDLCTVD